MRVVSILALSVTVAAAAPGLCRFRSTGGLKPYAESSSVEMMQTADVDLELNLLKILQESAFGLNTNGMEIDRTIHNINDVVMRILNSHYAIEEVRINDGTFYKEGGANIENSIESDSESSRLHEEWKKFNAEVSNYVELIEAHCARNFRKFKDAVRNPDFEVTKRKLYLLNIDEHKIRLIGELHEHFKQYNRKHHSRALECVKLSLSAMLRCYKNHCDKNVAMFAEIHKTLPLKSFQRHCCNGSTVCRKRAAMQRYRKTGRTS